MSYCQEQESIEVWTTIFGFLYINKYGMFTIII